MDRSTMAVFAGNANPQLAQDIARHLMVPLGRSSVGRFSDGETTVALLENVHSVLRAVVEQPVAAAS